MVPVR